MQHANKGGLVLRQRILRNVVRTIAKPLSIQNSVEGVGAGVRALEPGPKGGRGLRLSEQRHCGAMEVGASLQGGQCINAVMKTEQALE